MLPVIQRQYPWIPIKNILKPSVAQLQSYLMRYKEIFVHLNQGLSTLENRFNEFPSMLLQAIVVGTETCNTGAKTDVSQLKCQWKAFGHRILSGIHISVRDADNKLLPFEYLSIMLEVRKRKP